MNKKKTQTQAQIRHEANKPSTTWLNKSTKWVLSAQSEILCSKLVAKLLHVTNNEKSKQKTNMNTQKKTQTWLIMKLPSKSSTVEKIWETYFDSGEVLIGVNQN